MGERIDGTARPYTGELHVSPWDSLLAEVRRSAYRAAWVDERVDIEVERERQLMAQRDEWDVEEFEKARRGASAELRAWLHQSREERRHGAAVAASAVRAGLSERYIESIRVEAQSIARVLQRALAAADLTPEQEAAAVEELRGGLAELGRMLKDRHAAAGAVPERPVIES